MKAIHQIIAWVDENRPQAIKFCADPHACKTIDKLINLKQYEDLCYLYGMDFVRALRDLFLEEEEYEHLCAVRDGLKAVQKYVDAYTPKLK